MPKTQTITNQDYEFATVLKAGAAYLIHAAEDVGIEIWQEHEELSILIGDSSFKAPIKSPLRLQGVVTVKYSGAATGGMTLYYRYFCPKQ